ncbi:MAG: hypothetical protein QW057_04190 [Candidatus Bathyarchaeia archaeon]
MRALRLTILGLELALVILAVLSAYTLVMALTATVSEEENTFSMDRVIDPETGDWRFILKGRPRNEGFLDVTFGVKARLLTLTNKTLAEDENSTRVAPGGVGEFTVSLLLTKEMIDRYGVEQNQGAMELEIRIRTLMDLTGYVVKMRIRGEG